MLYIRVISDFGYTNTHYEFNSHNELVAYYDIGCLLVHIKHILMPYSAWHHPLSHTHN